jgi:hypothetical protein
MPSRAKGTAFVGLVFPLVVFALLPGCQPCPESYLPQEQLVARYNANASRVPRLWARVAMQVHLVDAKGRAFDWGSTLLPPNARLCLEKSKDPLAPADLVLIGYSDADQEIFRLGVSTADGAYYLWTNVGQYASGTYGHTRLAGAPGAGSVPINPLDLASVLAITDLPEDFSQPPTVLLRLNDKPGQCAYVLTYIDRQSVTRKIVARRDIYMNWDRDPNVPIRPFRVDLLDDASRIGMTATLKDYKPIRLAGEEAPSAGDPVLPSDIEVSWPKNGSRIHIVLSEIKAKGVDPEAFLFEKWLPSGVRENLTCVDPPLSTTQPGAR